jgi:hypothetical protein
MHQVDAVSNNGRSGRLAVLGAALAMAVGALPLEARPAAAASSPAAGYGIGDVLALDEFNGSASTLGRAAVGGAWATASPTGVLRLAGGAATWSGFQRGQTTHAWLPQVSALDHQLVASFAFGLISRASYGMSHRIVMRRQANGDGYVVSAAVLGNGQVNLALNRVRGGVVSALAGVSGAARLSSNTVLNVQARTVGTGPVHVVARAWVAGTTPPRWQIAYTDNAAGAVTSPGAVGVNAYMAPTGAGRSVTLNRIRSERLLAPVAPVPTTPAMALAQ